MTSVDMTLIISNMCTHVLNKTSIWCIDTVCGALKNKTIKKLPFIYIMTKLKIHTTKFGVFELQY